MPPQEFNRPTGPKVWLPTDVGISGVDLKAAGPFAGNILNVAGFTEFLLTFKVTLTGTTTLGTAKLTFDAYGEDSNKLIAAFDVVTAITYTVAQVNVTNLAWGGPKANIVRGTGTIAAASATDALRAITRLQVTVALTAVYNGTTAAGSVWLSGA